MHFGKTCVWHETGLRIGLYRANDPSNYGPPNLAGIAMEIHNLNPEVTTTHVFSKAELRRVALWMLWRSFVGTKDADTSKV